MSAGLLDRLGAVARGDRSAFADAARDDAATGPALQVTLAASLLDALGDAGGLAAILDSLAQNVLGWGLAVCAIHACASLLGLGRGLAPLFRALGLAALPFSLGLLQGLPLLGGLAALAQWGLTGVAFVLATAESLEAELPTAAVLALVGLGVGAGVAGALL